MVSAAKLRELKGETEAMRGAVRASAVAMRARVAEMDPAQMREEVACSPPTFALPRPPSSTFAHPHPHPPSPSSHPHPSPSPHSPFPQVRRLRFEKELCRVRESLSAREASAACLDELRAAVALEVGGGVEWGRWRGGVCCPCVRLAPLAPSVPFAQRLPPTAPSPLPHAHYPPLTTPPHTTRRAQARRTLERLPKIFFEIERADRYRADGAGGGAGGADDAARLVGQEVEALAERLTRGITRSRHSLRAALFERPPEVARGALSALNKARAPPGCVEPDALSLAQERTLLALFMPPMHTESTPNPHRIRP